MWRCVVLIAVLLSAVAAAAPATTQSTVDVESLVKRLSGDSWKDRQKAQDELVKLGTVARARLEQLVHETTSDEVRARAEAALQQITENEETGVSLITLDATEAEPKDVFAQIATQARAELEPALPQFWEQTHLNRVSMRVDHLPFWTAMREIGEQTGVELAQWNEGLRLVQTGGNGPTRGISVVSGPFLIVANTVNRSESIDLSQLHGPIRNAADVPPPERSFIVQLNAFAEPKLRLLQAASLAKLSVAIDDKGNSLLPPAPPGDATGVMTGITSNWTFTAALEYPGPKVGTRIKQLKGSVEVVLQTKFQTLEIPRALAVRNVKRSAGGMQILFKGLTKNGEQYELAATATLPDSSHPEDWSRLQSIFCARNVKLLDAKGVAWNVAGTGINGGNNSVEVTMDFSTDPHAQPTAGEPSRLVLQIPTEYREISVPFEFADLPIP